MDGRYVSSRDNWIFSLLGKSFHYKELEFEDDLDFKDRRPSNMFTMHSLVTYDADKREFIPPSVGHTRKSLHVGLIS